jgi:K+-sensing histidine kinase KdpD
VAFVFGNEAAGLPDDIVRRADATVRVPHAGRAESLNLAAAATVCLFDWARRHETAGTELETLIAAAAHDIRSPLTAMKGFGYALERRWTDMNDDQRALMLAGIVHDADRMDQTLRLLVDAARVASGALEPYPERTDLGDLVESIAAQQARDPEHPAITWRGDPGPFFVDATRLRTAILAFDEALGWWAGEGPIEVVAAREGGALVVMVSRGGPLHAAAPGLRRRIEDRPVRGSRRRSRVGRLGGRARRRRTARAAAHAADRLIGAQQGHC